MIVRSDMKLSSMMELLSENEETSERGGFRHDPYKKVINFLLRGGVRRAIKLRKSALASGYSPQ